MAFSSFIILNICARAKFYQNKNEKKNLTLTLMYFIQTIFKPNLHRKTGTNIKKKVFDYKHNKKK
jgi:hypothetical protein